MDRTCERCDRRQQFGTRRFRCDACRALVCVRCQTGGGHGKGQNSVRWSTCHHCQAEQETAALRRLARQS